MNTSALAALGCLFTAALYFGAWLRPQSPSGRNLVKWVTIEKLGLTEFLSCHAITLLAGIALAMQSDGGKELGTSVWWGLIGLYFVLGSAAYLFHRSHRALFGFYSILATRSLTVMSFRSASEEVLKAALLKNFFMFFPTMLLIAAIVLRRPDADTWQDEYIRGQFRLGEKISRGRGLLQVTALYLTWALVEWMWPRFS